MNNAMNRLWPRFSGIYGYHHPLYARSAATKWQSMFTRMKGYGLNLRDCCVLEVGCGVLYPYILLFNSIGVDALGIDIEPIQSREITWARLWNTMRMPKSKSLRYFARDLLLWLTFYSVLGKSVGVHLTHKGLRLIGMMNAETLQLPDSQFDFVYSIACFEHLADVPSVIREIKRVLKPDGIAEVDIHLFASLTGGHELDLWNYRSPLPGYKLWGHLIDTNWQVPCFLNHWREDQFRDAFEKEFEIRDRQVISHYGREYLTPEICAQLSPSYSVEELTTESVLYVLKKRKAKPSGA